MTNFLLLLIIFILNVKIYAVYYCFEKEWGNYGTNQGQFIWPTKIEKDLNNFLYIADNGNYRIQKFNSDGNFILQFGNHGDLNGQFKSISDLTIDFYNNIYILDIERNDVQKFDSDGNFILRWGNAGQNNGEFLYPFSVTTDNSYIYILDLINLRIQKFDLQGNFIQIWNANANNFYCLNFNNPFIFIGGSGKIFKYDLNGIFISYFQLNETSQGNYFNPTRIKFDKNGYLYAINSDNRKIGKYTKEGYFIENLVTANGNFLFGDDICIGENDEIFIVKSDEHKIQKFKPCYMFSPTPTFTPLITPEQTLTPIITSTPDLRPVNLQIQKEIIGNEFKIGNKIVYKIIITNKENNCAEKLKIWDTLPDELKFNKMINGIQPVLNGNTIIWDFTNDNLKLCNNESLTFEFETEIIKFASSPVGNIAYIDYCDNFYQFPDRHPVISSNTVFNPSMNKILVYPNPFNPFTAKKKSLIFENTIPGMIIKIYNISGENIVEFKCENITTFWDGKNSKNSLIAQGIYYILGYLNNNVLFKEKILIHYK